MNRNIRSATLAAALAFFSLGCQTVPVAAPLKSPDATNAWIEIDSGAFEKNIVTLKQELGPHAPKICAVMKADAYGHGVKLLMPVVLRQNLPCIAVASNEEARQVREAGFHGQLMRIRTPLNSEIAAGFAYDVEELFGNLNQARAAAALALKAGRVLRVHIALNSGGMSRNGIEMKTESGKREAVALAQLKGLRIAGIMTHFPVEERADVLKSLSAFQNESAWLIKAAGLDRSQLQLHTANSFATLAVPESRLDLIRPGGLFYGDTIPERHEYLRVMKFKSRVAAVNAYPKGNSVSYDRTVTLRRPSLLANIPVGYANGYRRVFSGKASVLIRGKRFPVIGRVTMNTIMVDVTEYPSIAAGDEVVLFGKQGASEITQAELEKLSGTILLDLYTLWGLSNPRFLLNSIE